MMTEEQKAKAKIHRDNMTEAQKERLRYSKRLYSERIREELKVKRSAYYQANKESMNANSKAYHQKARELKAATHQQRSNITKPMPKVSIQPANMTTLKEIAEQLGVIVALVRAISNDKRYGMPQFEMLRIDGVELYDRYEITQWIRDNNEMLVSLAITGMNRKNKGEYKVSDNIMLLINWLQASKHVTKHCNTQRVAINSNQFWARWA
jgi:hypothetical protein